MLLDGKVTVISGAAGTHGIGLATARLFAEHGARVVVLDLDAAATRAAAASLGDGHLGIACDVTDRAACARAAEQTLTAFGHVDALVNNAGIAQPLALMDITPEAWQAVIDVNLRGTLYLSQAFIPALRAQRRGAIACVSSVAAQRGGGIFGGPHYAASKAGVLGLAKSMARELGPDGIRVNCVTPGPIQTDIFGDRLSAAMRQDLVRAIPLGRLGEARDVAGALLFLASDLSCFVTGAVIDVNGGLLIHG